jgi:hypothetical protein
VSLLAISSCFLTSLSVTGSAVGFVTTSGFNRTCNTPLNQNQRHAIGETFQP